MRQRLGRRRSGPANSEASPPTALSAAAPRLASRDLQRVQHDRNIGFLADNVFEPRGASPCDLIGRDTVAFIFAVFDAFDLARQAYRGGIDAFAGAKLLPPRRRRPGHARLNALPKRGVDVRLHFVVDLLLRHAARRDERVGRERTRAVRNGVTRRLQYRIDLVRRFRNGLLPTFGDDDFELIVAIEVFGAGGECLTASKRVQRKTTNKPAQHGCSFVGDNHRLKRLFGLTVNPGRAHDKLGTMREITVPSGAAELAVTIDGDGASALVFLHAGVCDRRMWAAQLAAFAGRHRVVAYDRRGFGATQYRPQPYRFIDDLDAVLKASVDGAAVLVGCSQGGRIAVDFALTYPARVAGLVLVAPAISGAPEPETYPPVIQALIEAGETAERDEDTDRLNAIEAHAWLDGPAEREGRVRGGLRSCFSI
jgi:hypothetical protein